MSLKSDIPYVPSSTKKVLKMIEMAEIKKGEKCLDLGCGDGRVVIAMAKNGGKVVGVEINEGRAKESRSNVKRNRLNRNAIIHLGSIWDEDMSSYDVITVYGITSIMERLESKLLREAKKGCRVISNGFKFPHWREKEKSENVYMYVKS